MNLTTNSDIIAYLLFLEQGCSSASTMKALGEIAHNGPRLPGSA